MQDGLDNELGRDAHALRSVPLLRVVELESALQDRSLGTLEADEARAQERVGGVWGSGEEEEKREPDQDGEHALDWTDRPPVSLSRHCLVRAASLRPINLNGWKKEVRGLLT